MTWNTIYSIVCFSYISKKTSRSFSTKNDEHELQWRDPFQMLVWEGDCHICFKNRREPISTVLQMRDWDTGKSVITYSSLFNMIREWTYVRLTCFCVFKQRKNEIHLFKWVDEALLDEIQRMDEHQTRISEEIEDLRSSMKKTVEEEVMKHKNSIDVGCLGSILTILCLWSKRDW